MSGETCFLCPASWEEECEFCEMSVRYCREHKILHRRDSYCHLYTVDQLEGVGRIMVAGRDIEPGEVVYREVEMVVGPAKTTTPSCLGCMRRVNGSVRCAGCRWPLCSSQCDELYRHGRRECEVIRVSGERVPDSGLDAEDWPAYQAICPLRVLMMKTEQPRNYEYMMQFMDHVEDRDWAVEEVEVVGRIREEWGLGNEFSREEVLTWTGLIVVSHKLYW